MVNRFTLKAVAGYPLTVYGKGAQLRSYLSVNDTLRCLIFVAKHWARSSELKIYNEFTETFNVNMQADYVQWVDNQFGLELEIGNIENLRKKLEEDYYNCVYTSLSERGLESHLLTGEIQEEILEKSISNKAALESSRISRELKWKVLHHISTGE